MFVYLCYTVSAAYALQLAVESAHDDPVSLVYATYLLESAIALEVESSAVPSSVLKVGDIMMLLVVFYIIYLVLFFIRLYHLCRVMMNMGIVILFLLYLECGSSSCSFDSKQSVTGERHTDNQRRR